MTACFLSVFLVVFSQPPVIRQDNFSVGGGVSYRHGIKEDFSRPGINLEFYYFLMDNFRGGLDLAYYAEDIDLSTSAFEANLNAIVNFSSFDDFLIYGLLGGQFAYIEYDWDVNFEKGKYNGIGLNMGAGLEYIIDNIIIHGQPKATLYCLDTFRITPSYRLGVRYVFN